MRFNAIDGTEEEKDHLKRCSEWVNEIIYSEDFVQEIETSIVEDLQGYEEADVTFFFRDSSVAGMANRDMNLVRLNTKFFGKQLDRDCATLVHEWLHLLGYDHEGSKDYSSVPYSVGFLVEKLVREKANPKKSVWKWVLGGFVVAITLYFIFR